MHLGEIIKKYREEHDNMSMDAFALRSGLSKGYISMLESNKNPRTGKLKRAAKKAVIPGYGAKGTGIIKDPGKALYNKVYSKTSFSLTDALKKLFK